MLNRLSVTITYPILLLGLVLGVALLFGGLGVTGTERTSRDLLDRITDQTADRIKLAITRNLEGPLRLADLNERLIQTRQYDPADVRSFIPLFLAQMQSFDGIGAILVCNNELDTLWVERMDGAPGKVAIFDAANPAGTCVEWRLDSNGRVDGAPLGQYPYKPESRPWYTAAVDSEQQRGWSPLYTWATSDEEHPIGLGRSLVVKAAGERLAVIDVGFTVEELSDYLEVIEVSPNGLVFVIDGSGHLVATSAANTPLTVNGAMIQATDSTNPIISHAARIRKQGVRTDALGYSHASMAEHDGEEYLITATELALEWGPSPSWDIISVIPESDLMAGVRAVQTRLLLWGILVLVITAAGGILLSLAIVKPIVTLRKTADKVSEGDLNARFKGKGGREFAELARDLDAMCAGLQERLDLRNSLEVAMDVQQHLLPDDLPTNKNLDIAAFSTYCDETGGDYYDFPDGREITGFADGSLLVAIGDVTGHGIAAALIMATARASLRTRLRQGGKLGSILDDVNDVLYSDTPDGKFMTFLALLISSDGGRFRWTAAGHDPPIVFNAADQTFNEPDGGGVPLGIVPGQCYDDYECDLGMEGSILLIGTDGIWETADPSKELYGKDRLREIILEHRSESADSIGRRIIASLDAFRESDRPLDDVTLVVIKKLGQS